MDGRSRSGSLTSGTNHPAGVMTYFNVGNPDDKEIKLSYLNKKGDTIKTFSSKESDEEKGKLEVKKGSNFHSWNMRGEGAEKLKGMILWWADTAAPMAVPGEYKVVLMVGDESYSQAFKIIPDGNSETDLEGMQRQFDFITDVNNTVDKAHKSIKKIRKINSQLEAFQKQYKDNEAIKDLVEKAKTLGDSFSEIEKALYQTKNKSGQDPLNFPIKLTNKLAHLNSLVGMDDFPPTQQDIAVKNELSRLINIELTKFDTLITEEITAFNKAFNERELNYLFVEDKTE